MPTQEIMPKKRSKFRGCWYTTIVSKKTSLRRPWFPGGFGGLPMGFPMDSAPVWKPAVSRPLAGPPTVVAQATDHNWRGNFRGTQKKMAKKMGKKTLKWWENPQQPWGFFLLKMEKWFWGVKCWREGTTIFLETPQMGLPGSQFLVSFFGMVKTCYLNSKAVGDL